ncbi:hypothetical protein GCM10018773_60780 [Streptomyces candidus]|nr:hypothetical protein GCM10018773_60780 [Streptomyces candidus]
MSVDLSRRLVPDGLWELAAPLLPGFKSRPQGGGTAPVDERAVFTAGVRADQWVCLAASAADIPYLAGDSASSVHDVDQGGSVASAAPVGVGRARGQG